MALSSMTGFARGHGVAGTYAWAWELKSVNAKGLDLRLRLPPGWDAIEPPVRARAAEVLSRGTVFANLTVSAKASRRSCASTSRCSTRCSPTLQGPGRQGRGARRRALDGILALKGVMEVSEAEESEEERARGRGGGRSRASATALEGPRRDAPHAKAQALGTILRRGSTKSPRWPRAPKPRPAASPRRSRRGSPSRSRRCSKPRSASIADRLHQEAILLATKADIREELDRLAAHVAQAQQLIADGGPVGRKLDFLSQELNRESNTLCAKANDVELTNIGLELKAVVEQFREQVQNLE